VQGLLAVIPVEAEYPKGRLVDGVLFHHM
jgi:hypothetical protein